MNNYILVLSLLFMMASCSSHPDLKTESAGTAKIVFRSADGGQSWQDISKGLPEDLRADSIKGNSLFVNDKGLYVKVGNEFYHNAPNATAPFWAKENFSNEESSMAPGNSGKYYWGVNLKKTNGTSVWSPVLESSQEMRMRSAFETASGAIFISTDGGLYKTTDDGKTWRRVHNEGMDGNMAEWDGVLVAISMQRIIRSVDQGETWATVDNKGGVAFDVKAINGGFAAISSDSELNKRRLSTSYDGGKTWQTIDANLQSNISKTWDDRPQMQRFMTSIIQVGENFLCAHPHGIFRSSDKGKTWNLLLPSADERGFSLFMSGRVVYAIRSGGGC